MRQAALAVVFALAGACTCETGLDAGVFACVTRADCVDGWSCVQGLCVLGAPPDAGPDGGLDAGSDAGSDADGGVDAGIDAGVDAGVDTGLDAGLDAGVDAGVDAGSAGDACPCRAGLSCAWWGVCIRPLSALADPFSSNVLDGGTWATYEQGGATVSQPGRLVVRAPPFDSGYAGVYTLAAYDARDGGIVVELIDPGDLSLRSWELYVSIDVPNRDGGKQDYLWQAAANTSLYAYIRLDGGVQTQQLDRVMFQLPAMRFWRLRDERGRFYWEYSADGGGWTSHFDMPTPLDVSAVYIEVGAGTWDVESAGTQAEFRDLRGE